MASQTQGIQQLLTAEKRAAEKVAEARKSEYENFLFVRSSPRKIINTVSGDIEIYRKLSIIIYVNVSIYCSNIIDRING